MDTSKPSPVWNQMELSKSVRHSHTIFLLINTSGACAIALQRYMFDGQCVLSAYHCAITVPSISFFPK